MPRTKRTEGVKWQIIGMKDAGMKQVDIIRVLNVYQIVTSRRLKKHRETGSVKESKRSQSIIECKGLLLERMVCGMFSYDHMLQLKAVNRTLNSQKVPEQNSGI